MNDNEIECTRCGAVVNYFLNECPECGLNFYLPQDDDWQETWTAENTESDGLTIAGVSVAGLFFGWLSAGLVLFGFHVFVNITQLVSLTLFLIGAGIVSGCVGGYVAGWLSNDRHLLTAAVVGLLTILISVIIEGFWRDLTSETLLMPRVILTWIAILLATLGGGVLARNRSLRVDDVLFSDEEALYHELMVKIGYDRSLAARLIEFERNRAPKGTRVIWIGNAIARWERDNHILRQ